MVEEGDRVLSVSALTNISLRVLPLRSPYEQRHNHGSPLLELPEGTTAG